jgi:hypothetical protein
MAAGLGFKTFTTGEVLTAGDVNGYLMQGINVFTNATARDAAITAPAEGQFAFTKDNNSLWYYDGAAWVASGATGDIEGVTAGVGISGGGTSGTVTVTNSMATAIDAKGDLVPGTGADTFARLAVGANGTVLTADSAEATGLKWATPAGGGKVLQVVNATTNTGVNSSTNSYVDTTLTATITPSSATSKILVIASQNGLGKTPAAAGSYGALQLLRGATVLVLFEALFAYTNTALELYIGSSALSYLDSPNTTSATTYKTQVKNIGAVGVINTQAGGAVSTITLLEIGA